MEKKVRKWTLEEETKLLNLVKDNYTYEEISEKLGRSIRAIEMRLEKLRNKTMIYILLCRQDKFYIGKSTRIEERVLEHFSNIGSEWTKLYKPIEIIECFESTGEFDEDNYTKKYMSEYGIENVRGGSYSQLILPDYKIKNLLDELNSSYDRCFKCGKSGHFAKDCQIQTKNMQCYSCGEIGHFIKQCPKKQNIFPINSARLNENANIIKTITTNVTQLLSWFTTPVITTNYLNPYFYYNKQTINFQPELMYIFEPNDECSRCGRNNHTIDKCYAKTNIDGYNL